MFDVPVYAHSTYATATYGIRCEVSNQLGIENVVVNQSMWISEVRPRDYQGMSDVGVVAMLRNPDVALETLVSQPEIIFSLQIRVLQTASEGDIAPINCTTVHLSNIYGVKIQPRGVATPAPSLVIDSVFDNDPTVGEVRVAQSIPRGLFSFAAQSQVINTAVVDGLPVMTPVFHLVALSSGVLVNASEVTCQSDSEAFQLSSTCSEIILDGSETSGVDGGTVLTQVGDIVSSVSLRVWYPASDVILESTRTNLNAVQNWLTPQDDSNMQCRQSYQQAKLSASADFAYSPSSPVFRVSLLPLIVSQLNVSDSSVIEISDDGMVTALMPGSSVISGGPLVSPTTIVVSDEAVEVSSLDITVFSALNVAIPTPPYPLVSDQIASVNVERVFDSVNASVFVAVLAVTSDGSPVQVSEADGLTFNSLNSSVVEVNNGSISLIGRGTGDLLQVTWISPCNGEVIATGAGTLDVSVPEPESIQVHLSSTQITYPGDTATFGGIPTSVSLSVVLHYPDGLTRDATSDSRTQLVILQGSDLVSLTVMESNARIEPADPTSTAFGDVIIFVSFDSVPHLTTNVSLSVVKFLGVDILANPYPPYNGSDGVQKEIFFQIENTGIFQRGALQLQALLSDGSAVSVTDSPLVFFQAFSPAVVISDNVFEATQAGVYQVQGQLGPNRARVNLTVSDTPVVISSFLRLALDSGQGTLQGVVQFRDPLELDVLFSDDTVYPRFIPDAPTLFPSVISLFSDTPTVASVSSTTGEVTLLSNHHSLVTLTVTKRNDNTIRRQLTFACNLEPSIGDVDVGLTSGLPIPPVREGSVLSVPLFVNAGSSSVASLQLAVLYDFEDIDLVAVTPSPSWLGSLEFTDAPSTGLLTLTAGSEVGIPGLVHIATVEFVASSPGISSISGVILQLSDSNGVDIGNGRMRQFVAGQVDFVITSGRQRRQAQSSPTRTRRNTQCTSPLPCALCPGERELGDVNGDCVFTEIDPVFLLQYHAENLFNFELQSGVTFQASLIPEQKMHLDSDLNTAVDLQDAYFLLQTHSGFLNFLSGVQIQPVQESESCTVSINATLVGRRNIIPDPQSTEVFFDIGLPFDPSFMRQQLYERLIIIRGSNQPTVNKGLALQGGIIKASLLESGVYGVEFQTNLTLSDIGVSVIQVVSANGQTTNQIRTKAMFGHPDPPYTFASPLDITLMSFEDSTSVIAPYGYSPFVTFNNNVSSGVCLTPPGPPIINQTLYTATLAEDVTPGTVVLTFFAQSQSDLRAAFSIASGNSDNAFVLNLSSGTLSVLNSLDFEVTTLYRLELVATDPATGFSSSSLAEITVTDVNDNAPVFAQFSTNVSIPANSPVGSFVALVAASDADEGTNAIIQYNISSDGDTFAIDSTLGFITVALPLDFDFQNFYTVLVIASDFGEPQLTSSVALNITIQPPDPTLLLFDSPVYIVNVTENAPSGLSLLQVNAAPVSNETSDDSAIVYTLDTIGSPFSIIPETGEIVVNGSIDRETAPLYELQVSATLANTDRAIPAMAVVGIEVLDENDNLPEFFEDEYTAFLMEGLSAGSLNLVLTAEDDDLDENGTVSYFLEEASTLFSINSVSGQLTNLEPLDYESNQNFTLTVIASDGGTPAQTSSVGVTIYIVDVNDNAPTIAISPSERISVAEDISVGAVVAQASASDLDSESTNGALTFSLTSVDGSNSQEFTIDLHSGSVSTSEMLDFETTQVYELLITTRDHGTPSLSSTANLIVEVLDVNDNPPVFEAERYSLTVNESAVIGDTLLQLEASDNDTGINAELVFSLHSVVPDTDEFNVTEDGAVVLVAALDFESVQMYTLEVRVANRVPGTQGADFDDFTTVEIYVTDVNEFIPVFSESNYEASVMEEQEQGVFVIQVMATDVDTNSNIMYTLKHPAFVIDASGNIYTSSRLDREVIPEYILTVTASDGGSPVLTSTANVTVSVLDVNDNAPRIVPFQQNLTVLENTEVGTVLFQFTATDLDAGTNGEIGNFSLTSPQPEIFRLTVDGQLILASALDALLTPSYLITVLVEDNGSPPLSSQADLTIQVDPSPDPFFEQMNYSVVVEENNQPDTFLVQVIATSRNPLTVINRYSLANESDLDLGNLFAVDPVSGNVTALTRLDREEQNEYLITVQVEASFESTVFSASALISISLLDQNDNAPQFEFVSQNISVPENTEIGSVVATVVATDADVGSNADVVYSIVGGNDERLFNISQTGNVALTRSLISRIDTFNLTIRAANRPDVNELVSFTRLIIDVNPVNDFTPQFDMDQYSANVSENAIIGTLVITIEATDQDVGTAAEITYSISSGNEDNNFRIDNVTGQLLVAGGLDYEITSVYNLTVTAIDGGTPPMSSDALVYVQLIDVNDNPPVFSQPVYRGQLLENLAGGQSIVRVTLTDEDSPANSFVTVEVDLAHRHLFIVTASGDLQNIVSFDREIQSEYMLTLTAINEGLGVRLSATATVMVEILDANDNAPQFLQSNYSRILRAPIDVNTTIVQVQASDLDEMGNNSAIRFSLEGAADVFAVDPLSGVVSTIQEIASETNITFMVVASDLGTIPLSTRTSVEVTVRSPHDLTVGRERDLVFSTDMGIHFIGESMETAESTYQRRYGFLVGRDTRFPRSIFASLSTLNTSLSVSPSSLPATSIAAVLISSSVWHDDPTILVAVQARDETHSVHVEAQVFVRVTHPVQVASQDSSCTTQLSDGTCVVSISLPDTWFSTQANVTVEYGLSQINLQRLGNVELQQRPSFDIGSNIYVYMEMPLRNLYRNEFFDVAVFGEAGTQAVGAFSVTVSVGSGVILHSLDVNRVLWQAPTPVAMGGNITIAAVRADQLNTPASGRVQLFSIRAQVSASSPVDSLIVNAVRSTIISLSDFGRMTLLPEPGTASLPSSVLDRNGITRSGAGAIYVADNRIVGILPFVDQAELINTPLLDGNSVSFPMSVLEVRLSGTLSIGNTAVCSSEDPSVVDVAPDCSNLFLTTSQSRPSNRSNVLVSHGAHSAAVPVQVWTPVEITLTADDTTLNLVPQLLNPLTNCTPSWQYSNVKAFAEFTNSHDRVQALDVTNLVSSLLTTSNSTVLQLIGSRVHGLRSGTAQVQIQSQIPNVGLSYTVTEEAAELLGIDVQVVSGIRVSGLQNIGRLASVPLTVVTEQILDFEGVQAVATASAVFSDGFRLQLINSDITFSSLESNILQISAGHSVTAVGSGRGELVSVSWRQASQCGSEVIATGLGQVDVTIPLPSEVIVTVSSPVLAIPRSTAQLIGVPTNTTVQVIAMYSDGRRQDLTNDNRTSYTVSDGITITRGPLVILGTEISTQIDEHLVQISFTQFSGMERNVTITAVQVSDISLKSYPYPEYPGSRNTMASNLSSIASTGVREQALILADAILSNGERRDVSTTSELRFSITVFSPFQVSASINQNILTVSDATSFGSLNVTATLREVTSRLPLSLRLAAAAHIANIAISSFPEGNTFRGTVSSTRQVVVTATLDDGRQYVFPDSGLRNFVRFAASPATALTVDSNTGIATIRGNSLSQATITVTDVVVPPTVSRILLVACNLDPEVGDIDLGSLTGAPLSPQNVGSLFTVPVRVNSGSMILDSIDLDISFDPTIVRALSATEGPDWPSGAILNFVTDDPVNIISVGGTLVGSTPVSGTALHLMDLQFEAVGPGTVNISGVVNTLAEQPDSDGAPASNIGTVPRTFVAGSVQLQVTGDRRRREAASIESSPLNTRLRRQSSSCPSPPCEVCAPFREHGDIDGNCIFDVRDASFLQRYILTTIATGTAPAVPTDREAFLDSDLNGNVDLNDVVFLLRVNFRLLRFVSGTDFVSVSNSGDSCLLSFNITLLRDGSAPADNSSTSLIVDFAHENSVFQQMFDDTVFIEGSVLPVSKGPALFGGLVEAEYVGGGVYRVEAESAISQMNVGLSLIQVTFDANDVTSSVRTAAMFSYGIPRYGPIDASISLRNQAVEVATQLGYSPLLLVDSSLTTAQCVLQNQPLVFENVSYSTTVPENATVGTSVVQVQAVSNRPGAVITYSLNSTAPLPFSVDRTTGVITLSSRLDFETITAYSFEAVAEEPTNNGLLTASVPIAISVLNVNDLPPVVEAVENISLLANVNIMEEILQVNASDPDFLDPPLTFFLVGSPMSAFFTINTSTGAIAVASLLSSIANQVVQLTVSVSDGLFVVSTEFSIDVYLPSFTQDLYIASISEATATGSMILTVAVQNHRESFEFVIESSQSAFEVNASTGALTLREVVDFEIESQRSFGFEISAVSASITIRASISITVTNENDNSPVFSQGLYNLTLPSSTPIGSRLLQVEADDGDFGPTSAIIYQLLVGADSDLFSLDSLTGELVLIQTLIGRSSLIVLNVSATDSGTPPISSFVNIEIEIVAPDVPLFPIPPLVSATDSVLAFSKPQRSMESNDSMVFFEQAFGKLASQRPGVISTFYPSVSVSTSVASELTDAVSATIAFLHPSSVVYHDGREIRIAVQVRDSSFQTSTVTSTQFTIQATQVSSSGSNAMITSPSCDLHTIYGTCVAAVTLPLTWFEQSSTSTVLIDPLIDGRREGASRPITLQPLPALPTTISNEVLIQLPSRDIIGGESFTINVYGYSTYPVSGFSILFNLDAALMSPRLVIDSQWSSTSEASTNSFAVSAILSNPTDQNAPLANPMVSLFSLELSTSGSAETQIVPLTALVQSLTNVVEGSIVLTSTNTNSGPAFFTGRGGVLHTTGKFFIVIILMLLYILHDCVNACFEL